MSEQSGLNEAPPVRPPLPGGSAGRGLLIWNDSAELPARRAGDTTVQVPSDRWSFAGQPLARPTPRSAPRPRPVGPPGWLLGGLAIVLIAAVASITLWPLVVRPAVSAAANDGLANGLTEALAGIYAPTRPAANQIVISEADINGYLRNHAAEFAPLANPGLTVTGQRVRFAFTFALASHGVAGRPAVVDGRLVLQEVVVDGPAASLVRGDDAAALVADALEAVFARARLRPTGIELRDGLLIVSTESARS